jgi:7,8-dihydropterin-6-yl-methyl-4-(beta-D-ribofuranosyl)aminobenzene 5'-phosphate synthase
MRSAAALIRALALTVLVDDDPGPAGGRGEHGFSVWVDADHFRILFDSGAGARIEENARQMGIALAEADAFAVSHGHSDHTGGSSVVLSVCGKARFYLHPGALRERYALSAKGIVHPAGFPLHVGEALGSRQDRVHWTNGVTHLHPAVFVTGEIPRTTQPEAPGGRFFLDPQCSVPDPLTDDQALVIDTTGGAVVVLGCSHAGVRNTLSWALAHSQTGKLRAMVGGMHLLEAFPEALSHVGDTLERLGPELICPCHCTGEGAKEYLARRFPKAYRHGHVGTMLSFNGA